MAIEREASLGRAIHFLAQKIQNITERMLKPYNVTMEQLWVLRCLSESNAELTQSDICRMISKTPANVSRIINRLVSKSLIGRQPSPKDRRFFIIELTDQGHSLLRDADFVVKNFPSRICSGIDAESQDTTKRALLIIRANIAGMSKSLKKEMKASPQRSRQ